MISDEDLFGALTAELTQLRTHGTCVRRYTHLRQPEPQDIGKVVFNRNHRRTDANLIRARAILREAYISRHAGDAGAVEQANIYFDQALKTRTKEAWEALWKEVLKGNSKSIWHGKHWEDLTSDQRKLVLPMMKNYIEKYAPNGTQP